MVSGVFGDVHGGGVDDDGSVWGDEWLEDEGGSGGDAIEFELGVGDGGGFVFPEVGEQAGEIDAACGGGCLVDPFFGAGVVDADGDFTDEVVWDLDVDGDSLTYAVVEAFGDELGLGRVDEAEDDGQECERAEKIHGRCCGGVHGDRLYAVGRGRRCVGGDALEEVEREG